MLQSRLFFSILHWVHEKILMSAFRWLAPKKSHEELSGDSADFSFVIFPGTATGFFLMSTASEGTFVNLLFNIVQCVKH